jgi:dynein heavy chain
MSCETKPLILQRTLESFLEKRQGRNLGPPGGKVCFIFMDDISMPEINTWGDQITNELSRQVCCLPLPKGLSPSNVSHSFTHSWPMQVLGEGGLYSLDKPGDWTAFVDLCFLASMVTPGAGKNDIPNRLKRLFSIVHVSMPSKEAIEMIFGTILRHR